MEKTCKGGHQSRPHERSMSSLPMFRHELNIDSGAPLMYRFSICLLVLGSAAGSSGALGLRCSGEAMTDVKVQAVQNGPKDSSAVSRTDLTDDVTLTVTLSVMGSCWTVRPIFIEAGPGAPAAKLPLPRRPKRLGLGRRAKSCAQYAKTCQRGAAPQTGSSIFVLVCRSDTCIGLSGWLVRGARAAMQRRGYD